MFLFSHLKTNALVKKTFACFVLLFWFACFNAFATEDTAQKTLGETLCLQVKFHQGQSINDLNMLEALGVKWVREEARWADIEKKPGVYEPFSASLKARLSFYKAHHIGVIFIVAYENPVAYPNSVAIPFNEVNARAYGAYARYIATQLTQAGVDFVIELWNEPHNSRFKNNEALGGAWQGAPPSPWVDQYVAMVHAAVNSVHAFDPTNPIITDDDMWIVHYHFLDKGLPKDLAGFAVHPYNGGQPPEITAVEYDTDWTQPYHTVDQNRSFESAVRRLISHGENKLGKQPKLWVTEWGWRIGEPTKNGGTVTEEMVATYLPRAFILAAAAKVEAMCWFSAQDVVDGPMGLKTNDGRLRPAFYAFTKLNKTLGDAVFKCELENRSIDIFKREFAFKRNEDWIVAAWQSAEDAVTYQNMNGNDFTPACRINE